MPEKKSAIGSVLAAKAKKQAAEGATLDDLLVELKSINSKLAYIETLASGIDSNTSDISEIKHILEDLAEQKKPKKR